MKYYTLLLAAVLLFACDTTEKSGETTTKTETTENMKDNPFMAESNLPYHAPDFTKIKDEHFKPALYEGMKQQNEAIEKIVNNTEEPTFENTVLALETSGDLLDRVGNVFWALTGSNTNDNLKAIQKEISPKLAEHSDGIFLNKALFDRIKTLYDKRESLNLDAESAVLLNNYYKDFVKAGAQLTDEQKGEMKKINARLAELSTSFSQKLLDANNAGAIIVKDVKELDGLTEAQIESLKDGDNYKISLQNTTQQPLLSSLTNRELRKRIFEASKNRANKGGNNTHEIIKEIAKLRAEKAALLGYNNYAEWSLVGTMVKEPKTVQDMFAGLVPAAVKKAKVEEADLNQMTDEEFVLEPWDWQYYSEQLRKAKYDLDEEQIKPYFEVKNVLENGVFYAANRLYGITAKERTDIPTYHPDVLVYELFEEDGSPLGLFYGDYFARDSKRGGAWMSNFVTQSKLYDKKPVVYNVMNIQKPAEGQPALMTYDNVNTMFHEMGHALHGLFADQTYPSISGTSVARDFVEFPSQVNENWALHPEVLNNYAKHYKTGETIPAALVEKIKKAGTFNQGFSLSEVLAAANLDMQWHTIPADTKISSVEEFEKEALHKTGLDGVHAIPPRYCTPYFAHIWGGGYAAGYYSYLWTEMLSHDAYNWFENNGNLTRENGERFRKMVLSQGDTQDYETMYNNWRGGKPNGKHMANARGLN